MRNDKCGMKSNVFFTPAGWAGVAVSDRGVARVVLPKKSRKAAERELNSLETGTRSSEEKAEHHLARAVLLLKQYISGEDVRFDLPLDISYYTAFQQSVWRAATEIPCGETRSYGWIAKKIGRGNAARAVGQAMGANPVPILVP